MLYTLHRHLLWQPMLFYTKFTRSANAKRKKNPYRARLLSKYSRIPSVMMMLPSFPTNNASAP